MLRWRAGWAILRCAKTMMLHVWGQWNGAWIECVWRSMDLRILKPKIQSSIIVNVDSGRL